MLDRDHSIIVIGQTYYIINVCLSSAVVSVMDSHSCDGSLNPGQGNHIDVIP